MTTGLCSPREPCGAGWAVVLLEEAGLFPLPVTPQSWDLLLLPDPITVGQEHTWHLSCGSPLPPPKKSGGSSRELQGNWEGCKCLLSLAQELQ